MKPSRVLVLEDDPAIQRFIALTLSERDDLDLLPCHTLRQARGVLEQDYVDLLLMDLNLSDGSGIDLLHWLHESDANRAYVGRIMALSGAVDKVMKEHLLAQGAWKVLRKPVSAAELLYSVEEAMGAPKLRRMDSIADDSSLCGGALDEFFAGDRKFFEAYHSACLAAFPMDVREGDAAIRKGDVETLRRIAHNLKSVLRMLGYDELSLLAGKMELVNDGNALSTWVCGLLYGRTC